MDATTRAVERRGRMIPWWVSLITFVVGGWFGFMWCAIIRISKEDDDDLH